jgi:predicted transcriptional regulator
MNYNQHMTPDISSQSVSKLSHILGDQLRKLLEKTAPQEPHIKDEQRSEVLRPSNRTSEDDRLEFLGYDY